MLRGWAKMNKPQTKQYAAKETMVEVARWDGGSSNYKALTEWTGGRIRLSGTTLILQTPDRTETVELGSYIVKTDSSSFYSYSFADLEDIYVEVKTKAL